MTLRFCGSCMADVGLNPANSRLALPGCSTARMAFCDGVQHECVVLVNEHGLVVIKSSDAKIDGRVALREPALAG